jgi:hypothetical protein
MATSPAGPTIFNIALFRPRAAAGGASYYYK